MNSDRQRDIRDSLRRELDRVSQERNLSSTGRILWLLDQLDNYVERWLGLRAFNQECVGPPSDDLFHMIEIGAEAVSAELKSLESTTTAESWQNFLTALAAVRAGGDARAPRQLAKTLAVVRSVLGR